MSDRQQVSRVHVKNGSSKKENPSPKNVPLHQTHPANIVLRARTSPESLTPVDVLQLQRTVGNQAVGQMLAEIGGLHSTGKQLPLQQQEIPEEEELLQGKMNETVQRQPELEEEELLQGKFTDECIQCQELPEEEELLQGKMIETVQRQEPEEEEPIQGKFAPGLTGTLQAKDESPSNRTGMPDHLKSGLENLSGVELSGVRVHYNSSKPEQLNALAYTQGQDIHVAPGQEKHLPHEGWHVVQQSQGRVKPTLYARGVAVNDDQGLEREADVMGAKSLKASSRLPANVVQKKYDNEAVAQLEPGGDEHSSEQQELLDLLDVLQKNKSKITSVSENEVEEAISGIMQIVQSGDESTISEVLKKIKSVAQNAETGELESGTVQLAPWSTKGAVIGALLGTIVPVIGNIVGGIIGYKLGKKKDQINQLYADGATPAEVTAMLAIEPDAQTIHNYMTTVDPRFTLANILFASMAGGNVGSIYFTDGRIRLTHVHHPEVSVHVGITRHTISDADYNQYRIWLRNGRPGGGTKAAYIRGLPSFAAAVAGAGERLVEFWPGHQHISRGGPVAFNYVLTQAQLNIICNVARLHDNNTLRAWMGAIPALAAIPIN